MKIYIRSDFGFGFDGLSDEDFSKKNRVYA